MDELQQALHKLDREHQHLSRIAEQDFDDRDHIDLALSQAKRVRSASTILVRAIARHRDQLQPKEGTSA